MPQFYIRYFRSELVYNNFMKKKLIVALILFLITLPTFLPFFNSRFFYTQDHIFIARLNQMSAALSDGQFPVRWAPDLRYGEPLFNFYAPLPYYVGALIHLLGFNFIWVAKILFILSTFLSAFTMYILADKLFGRRAAILSAILYTYAPYRAVDIYVRGALSETWAFIFFPLVFYTSWLISKKITTLNVLFLALSLAGLFLTHNVTALMFMPFLFLWWSYLIIKEKKGILILYMAVAALLALGLSASFILPASFERDLIQTKYLTVGYFNFRAHFVAVKQFFYLFWGYGSSLWGPEDGLSFQVGLVNWLTLMLAGLMAILIRKDRKLLGMLLILGVGFIFSVFLQHNKSSFIWEAIPLMAFIQFPWRFLGISIFLISMVGALITPYLRGKFSIAYFLLIIAAILSTFVYFRPKEYVDDNFFDKFLNKEKMRQGIDLTKDYLPIWVKTVDAPLLNYPQAESGEIGVDSFEKGSTQALANMTVLKDSIIEVPITYFPNWQVIANNKNIPLEEPNGKGLIRFKLPVGKYQVKFEFGDTPVRVAGNLISLASLLIMLLLLLYRYKKKIK